MVIGLVGAVIIFIGDELIADIICSSLSSIGISVAINNILEALLDLVLITLGTYYLFKKLLKVSLSEMRIYPLRIKTIWIVVAIAMPLLTLILCMIVGGH